MRTRNLFISLVAATLAVSALAQTKTSGTAVCKEEAPAPVAVGDVEGHAYAVGKSQCTWSKFEVGGVPFKEGVSVLTVEMRGNESKGSGYHTATLANGDKCSCSFTGTSTSRDNKFVSGGGTWTFTSGTGKCKGIKGKGTYKGTPNPDGTVSYQVDGEYTLP